MIASHGHLDHMGRYVLIFKGVMAEHGIEHLPVFMSQATRHLLPAILKSYHQDKKDSVSTFDDNEVKFWHKLYLFFRSYRKKPRRLDNRGKNHGPHGDLMRERAEKKAREKLDLENAFMENGGIEEK